MNISGSISDARRAMDGSGTGRMTKATQWLIVTLPCSVASYGNRTG